MDDPASNGYFRALEGRDLYSIGLILILRYRTWPFIYEGTEVLRKDFRASNYEDGSPSAQYGEVARIMEISLDIPAI